MKIILQILLLSITFFFNKSFAQHLYYFTWKDNIVNDYTALVAYDPEGRSKASIRYTKNNVKYSLMEDIEVKKVLMNNMNLIYFRGFSQIPFVGSIFVKEMAPFHFVAEMMNKTTSSIMTDYEVLVCQNPIENNLVKVRKNQLPVTKCQVFNDIKSFESKGYKWNDYFNSTSESLRSLKVKFTNNVPSSDPLIKNQKEIANIKPNPNTTNPTSTQLTQIGTRNVHLILIGDTEDDDIGGSVITDLNKMKNLFQSRLAKKYSSSYNVMITKIEGEKFTKSNILQQLTNLKVSSQDVVFTYISSHGENNVNSEFPSLKCHDGVLSLELIASSIAKKKPKLNIVVGDMCNVIIKEEIEEMLLLQSTGMRPLKDIEVINVLFNQSFGQLMAASARKGEYAFVLEGQSIFTGKFIDAFNKTLNTTYDLSTVSWDNIFKKAIDESKYLTNNEKFLQPNKRKGQNGILKSDINK